MTAPWRRPLAEVNHERAPRVYRILARLARLFIPLVSRRHWAGQDNIPATGPVIVVANHTSNFDALSLGEFLIWSGRWPRFLGKADLWRVPLLGWVARRAEQIPVYRDTAAAGDSLVHAAEALREGRMVAIFPEGTITADPDGWPMTGRRGAARLALTTGATLLPVATAGGEKVLGGRFFEPWRALGRRKDVYVTAGEPLDVSHLLSADPSKETLDEVTDLILDRLTRMRADLTGLTPPAGRFDLRVGHRVAIGPVSPE